MNSDKSRIEPNYQHQEARPVPATGTLHAARRWRASAASHVARLRARAVTFTATLAIALAALPAFSQAPPAQDQKKPVGYIDGGNLSMVRFEFDNDTFVGSDDVFSAGWSLQFHSGLKDKWDGPLGSQIGRLPLLGDDGEGGRVVRRSFGLSQNIFSPDDLTVVELQPDDAPYAGTLGVHGAWASYDNRRFASVQLYAGCMGPCSQAEDVQRFVHEDMDRGTPPKGWDNQLDTKWLGNVNFAWRRKLLAPDDDVYFSRRWANDLTAGGQVAVGNAAQLIDAHVEYRFGWSLPMGFTHIPDPAPRGVILDPVYVKPGTAPAGLDGFRAYASIVVRATAIDHVIVRDGGDTENGGYHPGFEANEDEPELLVGLHAARRGYAVHVTYYRFIGSREEFGPGSTTDWVNISLERRF
jgi:hypothetical protein